MAALLVLLAAAAAVSAPRAAAQNPPPRIETQTVFTSDELQKALLNGVKHVVLGNHIDMSNAQPAFANAVGSDVVAFVGPTPYSTATIRGNCTTEPPGPALVPPRLRPTQCHIRVFEDFMEQQVAELWMADLYVEIIGGNKKDHATLIGMHGQSRALYMTHVTMRGDGLRSRAVDVLDGKRTYSRDCVFTGMNKTEEAAWRVNGGATATFHRCTFASNRVETPNAGPAIGLRSDGERSGQGAPSSAWIMGCTFEDNRPLEKGDVSVQAGSRLYSNLGPSGYPKVWDVQSGRLTDVWRLTGSTGVAELPGDAQKFNPVPFATERDRFFQDAVQDQARATGLPAYEIQVLETDLIVTPPPAVDGDDGLSSRDIYIICGCAAAAVAVATLATLCWLHRRWRRKDAELQAEAEAHLEGGKSWASGSAAAGLHSSVSSRPRSGIAAEPGAAPPASLLLQTGGKLPSGAYTQVHHEQLHPAGHGMLDAVFDGGHGEYARAHAVRAGSNRSSAAGPDSHHAPPTPPTPYPPQYDAPAVAQGGMYGPPARLSQSEAPGSVSLYIHADDLPAAAPPQAREGGAYAAREGGRYGAREASSYSARQASPYAAQNGSPYAGQDASPYAAQETSPYAAQATSPYAAQETSPYAAQNASPYGAHEAYSYAARDTLGPMVPYGAAAAATPRGDWDGRRAAMERSVESSLWRETAEASAAPYGDTAAGASSPGGARGASIDGASGAAHSYAQDAAPPMFAPAHARTPSEAAPAEGYEDVAGASPPESEGGPRAVTPLPAAAPRRVSAGGGSGHTRSFERTVAPNENVLDATHDDVVDMLQAVHDSGARFLGRFALLSGVHQRFGGQGVVQFGTEVPRDSEDGSDKQDEAREVAMKFYIVRAAFDRVLGLYRSGAAAAAMGAVIAVVPNNEGAATGGCVLPPCVVTRRGESLEEWARRTRPNLPTALQALLQIATAMQELHVMGYVYYAMKPSNVALLLPERTWALSDFGCVARKGAKTGLSFSLNYAAPEVLAVQAAGGRVVTADAAADVWALGVVAYELLTGARVFPVNAAAETVRAQILGAQKLPWEAAPPRALRTARNSVLHCLSRDPDLRPSAAQVAATWRNLLDFAAVRHTLVTQAPAEEASNGAA